MADPELTPEQYLECRVRDLEAHLTIACGKVDDLARERDELRRRVAEQEAERDQWKRGHDRVVNVGLVVSGDMQELQVRAAAIEAVARVVVDSIEIPHARGCDLFDSGLYIVACSCKQREKNALLDALRDALESKP